MALCITCVSKPAGSYAKFTWCQFQGNLCHNVKINRQMSQPLFADLLYYCGDTSQTGKYVLSNSLERSQKQFSRSLTEMQIENPSKISQKLILRNQKLQQYTECLFFRQKVSAQCQPCCLLSYLCLSIVYIQTELWRGHFKLISEHIVPRHKNRQRQMSCHCQSQTVVWKSVRRMPIEFGSYSEWPLLNLKSNNFVKMLVPLQLACPPEKQWTQTSVPIGMCIATAFKMPFTST